MAYKFQPDISFRRVILAAFAVSTVSAGLAGPAAAADLIYTPVNPSFGGNPLNSQHLLGLANAQNQFKSKQDQGRLTDGPPSRTEQFLQMLESQLYSSLANQVSQAIFGPNAQKEGTIKFQDQQVTFINTGTEIRISVTDFTTGQVTQIVVPTLVTNN